MRFTAILLLLFGVCHADEKLDIQQAQQYQQEFDAKYFEINEGFEKVRHVLLHLVKSTGKMATYCEAKEHGHGEPDPSKVINEVLPDLFIHAMQLANYYQIDLGEKYEERIKFIRNRAEK